MDCPKGYTCMYHSGQSHSWSLYGNFIVFQEFLTKNVPQNYVARVHDGMTYNIDHILFITLLLVCKEKNH